MDTPLTQEELAGSCAEANLDAVYQHMAALVEDFDPAESSDVLRDLRRRRRAKCLKKLRLMRQNAAMLSRGSNIGKGALEF